MWEHEECHGNGDFPMLAKLTKQRHPAPITAKAGVCHEGEDRKYKGRKHRRDTLRISLNWGQKVKATVLEALCCALQQPHEVKVTMTSYRSAQNLLEVKSLTQRYGNSQEDWSQERTPAWTPITPSQSQLNRHQVPQYLSTTCEPISCQLHKWLWRARSKAGR